MNVAPIPSWPSERGSLAIAIDEVVVKPKIYPAFGLGDETYVSQTFARLLSTAFVGGLTVLMAARAHEIGLLIAFISFVLGAGTFALGERWLGRPGRHPRRTAFWAAMGAAIAVSIGSAASGLGLAELPFMIAAAAGGFVTGLFFVVAVTRWGLVSQDIGKSR